MRAEVLDPPARSMVEEFIARWTPICEEFLADLRKLAEAYRIAGIDPRSAMSIEELDLSVRVYNCVKNLNISTVGQLLGYTRAELLRSKNFGKISLKHLERELARHGLKLKEQC